LPPEYQIQMSSPIKSQEKILAKFNIEALNEMQLKAGNAIRSSEETILLSPTGTGKTLAFLLPVIEQLDISLEAVQCLILVPSRELAIQIEQVAREMGTGYKINAVYGGRQIIKDKAELKQNPAILIGTPGRVADHIRRNTVSTQNIKVLVLDEFDKSLEIGFEKEMSEITESLHGLTRKILTSATDDPNIPDFVGIINPHIINHLHEGVKDLSIKIVSSPVKDKLDTLVELLCHLGNKPGIVFCNYRESIQRVSDHLKHNNISHECFYGGMEQKDRERSLIKFRNGSSNLLLATDLAARGIDIQEIRFIIHYHLPLRSQEFTHRNGRTARMHNDGAAYVIKWKEEELPEFITSSEEELLISKATPKPSAWTTLFISGGRKDKISKGDIVGLLIKQGELNKDQIGIIELKQDCAFVAVHKKLSKKVIAKTNNSRLKKKKIRVYEV